MKRMRWVFGYLFAFTCCNIALAQAAKSAPPTTPGQALDRTLSIVESEFVPAAEAMPEDKYGFAPSNGEFKGVRTFSQQVKHVAAVNYIIGAGILGEKPPLDTGGERGPNSIQTKAEIVKFLKDSFAYAHQATLTIDKNALDAVKNPFGEGTVARMELATWIPGHCYDHYGQMVEYLRMNGIIPPASRQ
jgi:DinB superfamily